jgi:hypothetical protein
LEATLVAITQQPRALRRLKVRPMVVTSESTLTAGGPPPLLLPLPLLPLPVGAALLELTDVVPTVAPTPPTVTYGATRVYKQSTTTRS